MLSVKFMIFSNKLFKLKYIYFFISTLIICSTIFAINTIEKDLTSFKFQIFSKKSGNVHVYINDFASPYMFHINENEEKNIVIDNLFQDIDLIRIDPPKVSNNIFSIKDLTFENQKGIFFEFNTNKILNWGKKDLETTKIKNDKIEYKIIGNDPYLFTGEKIQLDGKFKFLNFFHQFSMNTSLVDF